MVAGKACRRGKRGGDMALSYFARIVEERIREAQKEGAFDNLPGKGKPIVLEDMSMVPEDLRVAYHLLKNAHVLPPEAELQKEIHTLQDLIKYIEDDDERRALAKQIEWKVIRLDLLRKRSFSWQTSRLYGKKLVRKFLHK
jgi:hypothetical protein